MRQSRSSGSARDEGGNVLIYSDAIANVLLTLCLRTGDARYATVVKPFTQGEVAVPRAEREKRARELLEAYARSLEQACCRAPCQRFSFYDFWDAQREGG